MEPYFLLSLSVIGALVLVGIGILIRNSQHQGEKIDGVSESLASITATLSAIALRVDALDRWKDAMQQRENDDLRAENLALRENRGRREGDNV